MFGRELTFMASGGPRAAITVAIAALAVSACGVTGPDPAACKGALQASYVRALAGKGQFDPHPAACRGLPETEVRRFVRQVRDG